MSYILFPKRIMRFFAYRIFPNLSSIDLVFTDAVLPFIMFNVAEIASPGRIAQLFSKERFEHTHLILQGAKCPFSGITWENGQLAQGWMGLLPPYIDKVPIPAPLGLYLPKDLRIDAAVLAELDELIGILNADQTPFRIISEEKLTEQWDGIDKLIVPEVTSSVGRRKLLGFIAAGGTIQTFENAKSISV